MSALRLPLTEVSRHCSWGDLVEVSWWEPTTVDYDGRSRVPVVLGSSRHMYVFNTRGRHVDTTVVPNGLDVSRPFATEFWPLHWVDTTKTLAPVIAEKVRPATVILARVGKELGLVDGNATPSSLAGSWRIAYGCLLLGFYPPMRLPFAATPQEWARGVQEIGPDAARQVRQVVLDRLFLERRVLDARTEEMEREWQ